jgi:methyl-accepting chemotaxis protein
MTPYVHLGSIRAFHCIDRPVSAHALADRFHLFESKRFIEMNFDNLKLRTKTLIPLLVMALVAFAMVAFGASELSKVSDKASEIIERRDMASTQMARASRYMLLASLSVSGSLLYDSDSPEGRTAEEEFPKAITKAESLIDEAMTLAPDKAPEMSKFKDRFQALVEKSIRPMQIGKSTPGLVVGGKLKAEDLDQMAEGAKLSGEIDLQMRALIDDIVKFNNALLEENAKAAADLRAQSSGALIAMGVVGLVATLLAGAFSMWISSFKIARPLAALGRRMAALADGDLVTEIAGQSRRDEVGAMARAVQIFKQNAVEQARLEADAAASRAAAEAEREQAAAERARAAEEQAQVVRRLGDSLKNLAGGDLTVRLDDGFSETYAQIRDDFNEAIDKLKETMAAVVSSTGAIQSGTLEISKASDDLSRRTEQQAASLEETAAALDEITATVKKSAEGVSHARHVVAAADDDAKKSAVVVREAVEAMDTIAKSAQQISRIIGVIDEIAFQTNLLALNAGVEAARAGDAGRGFAVVASEVRALAQRSAEAAKEIKGLISASTTQVDRGVKLVAETGKSLERIMAQVTDINDVVSAIAAGAHEQATGLEQINTAINQMDQVTQQNAAMVEESTAASHSLSQETSQLSSLIGKFQVDKAIGEVSMRHELLKAAPHAFGQPAAAVARAEARRPQARLVRQAAKTMLVKGPAVATAQVWEEF